MSQLPFTRTTYATVPPSGESVGDFSSPASSLTRVKWLHGASGATDAPLVSHAVAAAMTATAAMLHGNQGTVAPRAGKPAVTAAVVEAEDPVDSVSRAKARSLADWKRRSGVFSRQRRTIRSREGEIAIAVVSRSGGSLVRIAVIVSAAVSPLKARTPLSIS